MQVKYTRGIVAASLRFMFCIKGMLLREVAESFQRDGIIALICTTRKHGLSDGCPRNEIDAAKQIED